MADKGENNNRSASVRNEIVPVAQPINSINGTYQPSNGGSNQGNKSFSHKYDLKNEIGVGSTSKCFRCIRKSDGQIFACKVIDKKQVEMKFSGLLDQFSVEIKVLKTLKHPNIIRLEDTFETSDRIYMVMEMMMGGELFDHVVEKGTLSEEEASTIVRKVTSAVAHMHALDIIHRDLKPENLLLTSKGKDAEVKLIDFGLAKETPDNLARSFLGTRGYLAPEMLQRHSYDKAIDIWALGVIVFVLLCGCLPFDDDSSRIATESAARKKFTLRFPRWASTLSVSAKDLLHNLLDVNPKTRYALLQRAIPPCHTLPTLPLSPTLSLSLPLVPTLLHSALSLPKSNRQFPPSFYTSADRYTADQALNHPWVSGRTVQPNVYLQSPSMIGARRQELRSPLVPHVVQVQTKNNPGGKLDAIKEENSGKDSGRRSNSTSAPRRKNSI